MLAAFLSFLYPTMLRWVSTMLLPLQILAASFLVQDSQLPLNEDVKVPVHLGVMSRCPDALLCESIFDKVLTRVGGKVDLSLVYVGRYVRSILHSFCSGPIW